MDIQEIPADLNTDTLEFYKKVLDTMPALVYINELQNPNDPASVKNVYLNRFGHNFIGYTRDEIDALGVEFFQKIIHPDDLEIIPVTVEAENDKNISSCLVSMHRLKPKSKTNYQWHYDHGLAFDSFPDGTVRRGLFVSVNVNDTMTTQNQLTAALKEISRLKYALKLSVLTTREKEVLHLIAKGKTDKEISAELFISLQTAKKHRNNLIHKTAVTNTAELVALAVEAGEY